MTRTITALATERRKQIKNVWDDAVALDEIAVQVKPLPCRVPHGALNMFLT